MYSFSKTSLERLEECHFEIQAVMHQAIKYIDFTVLCGHRDEDDQNQAYEEGSSQLKYPESTHNSYPSNAVDIAPWPIVWEDREQFYFMGGIVLGIAHNMGIHLRYGGDWNMNGRTSDNSFDDLVHFERFNI